MPAYMLLLTCLKAYSNQTFTKRRIGCLGDNTPKGNFDLRKISCVEITLSSRLKLAAFRAYSLIHLNPIPHI